MSGFHNNYQADTVGLRETMQELADMAGTPQKLLANYDRTVEATRPWNGHSDDFFKETEPGDEQQTEATRAFLGSLTQFMTSVQSAVGKSLGSIEDVHEEVQDSLHDAESNAGDFDSTGDHGKR